MKRTCPISKSPAADRIGLTPLTLSSPSSRPWECTDEGRAIASLAATRAGGEYAAGTGDVFALFEANQSQIDSASQHAAIRRMRM